MPTENPANQYLTVKVMSAAPEELRLMLIEGAIKFCRQGQEALARKDFEGCHKGYTRCREIILELMNTMRANVDPELCGRLSGIYTFMYTQLVESSATKDAAKADQVIALLEYDRETWLLLMKKLAEQKGAGAAAPTDAPPANAAATAANRPALSLSA
ncbi:MAG: flagellar export chaperone FliS [Phycisphaerales bacterium]